MKKFFTVLSFFCFAFVVSVQCFAADPVTGYWISFDDKSGKQMSGWYIYEEGGKLYGKILSVAGFPQDVKADKCKESYKGFPVAGSVKNMTVVGTPWIFGLTKSAEGQWKGGNIIDPESGNMYSCKITFRVADGKKYRVDTLEMRGEIGLGIGRSQFWTRTDAAGAAALR
jgi:uncharacterized protein (DUF2147 family)